MKFTERNKTLIYKKEKPLAVKYIIYNWLTINVFISFLVIYFSTDSEQTTSLLLLSACLLFGISSVVLFFKNKRLKLTEKLVFDRRSKRLKQWQHNQSFIYDLNKLELKAEIATKKRFISYLISIYHNNVKITSVTYKNTHERDDELGRIIGYLND